MDWRDSRDENQTEPSEHVRVTMERVKLFFSKHVSCNYVLRTIGTISGKLKFNAVASTLCTSRSFFSLNSYTWLSFEPKYYTGIVSC